LTLAWVLDAHRRSSPLVFARCFQEDVVPVPFRGRVNVDIRDSEPDWAPFEPQRAPDGAPSVLYIVLDDVGFSAMSCYGGPIETPNIDRIASSGVRFTQWHTTALCSPTRSCLLTGRNHTRNSIGSDPL
jgi:arylsulfatase